ncbi:MAG: polymer-forming cytoskeletal protein [Patescibacteria group bacterium]
MLKGQIQDGESTGPGTVVGVNVALSGTLKDQNDVSVYGMVDGEVVSEKTVTVGQSAQIKGPIRGKIITVAGVVRGSIDASEKLEVMETGKIFGSVVTKDFVVRSGAQITGKVTMGMDDDAAVETADSEPDPDNAEETLAEAQAEAKEESSLPLSDEVELKPDEE